MNIFNEHIIVLDTGRYDNIQRVVESVQDLNCHLLFRGYLGEIYV